MYKIIEVYENILRFYTCIPVKLYTPIPLKFYTLTVDSLNFCFKLWWFKNFINCR
jgi:hypothetical protein